jgi:nitroreductase
MAKLPNPLEFRKPDHEIETIFLKRWSPRAMSGAPVAPGDLYRLFEAARWAPSTYNEQEWRYLYAYRDTQHWKVFFDVLLPANQAWCANAGVLVVVIAHKVFALNGQPNPVYHFDAGASAENLMLQGAQMRLVVHAMAGFDAQKARAALRVPDDWEVLAMIAIGHPGDPDELPAPLREREVPTLRKTVAEIAWEGGFRS